MSGAQIAAMTFDIGAGGLVPVARNHLELFAGDETWFGAFSEAALPLVIGMQVQTTARDMIGTAFETAFGEPAEPFVEHLDAITRAAASCAASTSAAVATGVSVST